MICDVVFINEFFYHLYRINADATDENDVERVASQRLTLDRL